MEPFIFNESGIILGPHERLGIVGLPHDTDSQRGFLTVNIYNFDMFEGPPKAPTSASTKNIKTNIKSIQGYFMIHLMHRNN